MDHRNEMVVKLNGNNFKEEVLEAKEPFLVDFYADWCGPCQLASPVLDKLAKQYQRKIKVGKVDIDQNQALAQKYNVLSIPTVLIFKNGQEAKRMVGFPGKAGYETLIQETL
jgi:thioredoxin 1